MAGQQEKHIFGKICNHQIKEGTRFQDIVSLYYFDYDLRNILQNYLNRIEVNLRTYIVYTVSNHYKTSPTWFADPNIVDKSYADIFEEKVYKTIRENPVIKRHHKKYINDRFAPAWKTVEFMTLGNICSLYLNLKDRSVQHKIAAHYGCGIGVFINYIMGKISRNRQQDRHEAIDKLLSTDRGEKTNEIIFKCTGFPMKNLEKAE